MVIEKAKPDRRSAIRKRPKPAPVAPRNIWRELAAIGEAMPLEDQRRLPRDGAKNFRRRYLDDALRD